MFLDAKELNLASECLFWLVFLPKPQAEKGKDIQCYLLTIGK